MRTASGAVRDLITVRRLRSGSQQRDTDAALEHIKIDERGAAATVLRGRCPQYVALSVCQRGQSTRLRTLRPLRTRWNAATKSETSDEGHRESVRRSHQVDVAIKA